MLTSLRRWSKRGVVAALLLLTLSRVVVPAWAMSAPGPDGFVVVMCSTAGGASTPIEPPAPERVPAPHPDCAEHCLGSGGLALAPPPSLASGLLPLADGSNSLFPESRRWSAGFLTRTQTARAPPVFD